MEFGLGVSLELHDDFLKPGDFPDHLELIMFGLFYLHFFEPQLGILQLLDDLINQPGSHQFILLVLACAYISGLMMVVTHLHRSGVRAFSMILRKFVLKRI